MKSLVIDGSTTLSFLLKDQFSVVAMKTLARARDAERLFVPCHWWLEISNALLMAERRRRASRTEVEEALQLGSSIAVTVDEQTAERCARDTLSLARQYALTIYDAAYLELAIRRRSSLATIDKALARAARSAGVELLT